MGIFTKKNQPTLYTYEGEHLDRFHVFSDCPNPDFQRLPFLTLNGYYDFTINGSSLIPGEFKGKCLVPYVFDSLLSEVKRIYKRHLHYHLHYSFSVNETFFKKRVFLNLLRVSGTYTLYLNANKIISAKDSLNLRIEVTDSLVKGNNFLDFDFVEDKSEFIGISGGVYLDFTGDDPIKEIRVSSNLKNETVTFLVDALNSEGEISLITPNNLTFNYPFKGGKAVITLSDIVPWTPEKPFFYQYTVTLNTGDRVRGTFSLSSFEVGVKDGISAFFLNHEPYPIRGVNDDAYYPDGLLTMPSINHVKTVFSEIKNLGFNAIHLMKRLELPDYYYVSETRGLLVIQSLFYKDEESLNNELIYLRNFDAIALIIIHLKYSKTNSRKIERIARAVVPNKLFIIEFKGKTIGDLELEEKPFSGDKNALKKAKAPYLALNLEFKGSISEEMQKFMKEKYIKSAINGMVGFFYHSLAGNLGLFSPDFRKRTVNKNFIK